MKLKVKAIIALYNAIQTLPAMPYSVARTIALNKRILDPLVEAFSSAEKALVEQHTARDEAGVVVRNPNGSSKFIDPDAFNSAHQELLAQEEEVDIQTYPKDALAQQNLSPVVLAETMVMEAP